MWTDWGRGGDKELGQEEVGKGVPFPVCFPFCPDPESYGIVLGLSLGTGLC